MKKEIREIVMRAGPPPLRMGIKTQQTDFTENTKGHHFQPVDGRDEHKPIVEYGG